MIYLTATEITAVHHRILERTGQDDRVIQYPAGLSLVVNQPQMVVFGYELYPTVWLKAAYIMQKITKNTSLRMAISGQPTLPPSYFCGKMVGYCA